MEMTIMDRSKFFVRNRLMVSIDLQCTGEVVLMCIASDYCKLVSVRVSAIVQSKTVGFGKGLGLKHRDSHEDLVELVINLANVKKVGIEITVGCLYEFPKEVVVA